jgi:hypothetical protein
MLASSHIAESQIRSAETNTTKTTPTAQVTSELIMYRKIYLGPLFDMKVKQPKFIEPSHSQ